MKMKIHIVLAVVAFAFALISVCEEYYFDNPKCPNKKTVESNTDVNYDRGDIGITYHYWTGSAWTAEDCTAAAQGGVPNTASVSPNGGAGRTATQWVVQWSEGAAGYKGSVEFTLTPVTDRSGSVRDNVAVDGYVPQAEDDI